MREMAMIDVSKESIVLENECDDRKLLLQELLGQGAYGKVYAACLEDTDNCGFVVKLQLLTTESQQKSFRREIKITEIASTHHIGPRLYYHCEIAFSDLPNALQPQYPRTSRFPRKASQHEPDALDENLIGLMVLERFEKSLDRVPLYDRCINMDFLDTRHNPLSVAKANAEFVATQVHKKLVKLHKLNIVHADLLSKNILVNVKEETGKIEKLVLSDFGLSRDIRKIDDSWAEFIIDNRNYYFPKSLTKHLILPKGNLKNLYRLLNANNLTEAQELVEQKPYLVDQPEEIRLAACLLGDDPKNVSNSRDEAERDRDRSPKR